MSVSLFQHTGRLRERLNGLVLGNARMGNLEEELEKSPDNAIYCEKIRTNLSVSVRTLGQLKLPFMSGDLTTQ